MINQQINMNEFNRNFALHSEYSDNSFVGILHEKYLWDDEEQLPLSKRLFLLIKGINQIFKTSVILADAILRYQIVGRYLTE